MVDSLANYKGHDRAWRSAGHQLSPLDGFERLPAKTEIILL